MPAIIEDGYIVFETSHLSEYGVVATEKINDINNPNTSDNVTIHLTTGILSLITLVGISIVIYRKDKMN